MPVFFLPLQHITPPTVTVVGDLLRHLRSSLRVDRGDILLIGDGAGTRYRTVVTAVTAQRLAADIIETLQDDPPETPSVRLGQALLKGEKMDWVVQKATELGVTDIIPLHSRHSVIRPKQERIEGQTARWQRIALEAAQQSEQWRVPVVAAPLDLRRLSQDISKASLRLSLVERQRTGTTFSTVELPTQPSDTIVVIVGPEGGWAPEDVTAMDSAGFMPVTLGPTILRAETAAILAVSLLQYRLGRFE